jgi:hypothetical protein
MSLKKEELEWQLKEIAEELFESCTGKGGK